LLQKKTHTWSGPEKTTTQRCQRPFQKFYTKEEDKPRLEINKRKEFFECGKSQTTTKKKKAPEASTQGLGKVVTQNHRSTC
jgi:hypothetical protein